MACTGVPKGIQPVTGLNADKYLGKWYEIARLDHSFEEGLSRVTAEYELQDDGSIKVTNRGYAFVTGYDRDYLWFLSRTPDVSEEAIARFREVALKAGFDLEELVVVDHSSAK